jgi:tetratricopeptide (TPR) repeat protein
MSMENVTQLPGRIARRTAGVALAFCVVLASAGPLAAAQQNDRVILKNGKDKTVKIKTEDLDGVWYTATGGGGNTVIKWDEIDSIQYGGAEAYQKALEAYSSGRISEAAAQLEALAGDAELRPVLKQTVLYYQGLAQGRLGKPDAALATYKSLLEGFPKSRYLLPVGSNLLALYIAKDDAAGAARALEPVLAVAKDAGSNEGLQASFNVLRGRLQEEQKKFDEAESLFEAASKVSKADPDVIATAKLGLGRCAQKRGRPRDAETRYRDLVKADAPNTVLAGAWNGLGDIALEAGVAARDADGLRVAVLAYLRGVVLYAPVSGEPTEEHERALAGASRAFKAMSELEGNAERKQLFLDRARQRQGQLASQYPGSRYLKP